jgi:hypothetical protein
MKDKDPRVALEQTATNAGATVAYNFLGDSDREFKCTADLLSRGVHVISSFGQSTVDRDMAEKSAASQLSIMLANLRP